MALPASGPLALTDIQTEFGGANPIGMNEYYAGGGLVPPGTSGTYGAVPSSGALSIQNFYGTSNYIPVYIEELFSTYLYTGNNAGFPGQTITNGINLASNGGMVWVKSRTSASSHELYSSAQGLPLYLRSDSSGQGFNGGLNTFTTTGFQVDNNSNINSGSQNYASWTFREQPKFFDAVAYTGNGSFTRSIAHSLGSTPGCVIIKRTDGTGDWFVWHRSLDPTHTLYLNATNASTPIGVNWSPTSTTFTVTTQITTNTTGQNYVAYLFASDAGGFGLTGSDNVISCGSFTIDGAGGASVSLGYEPQWFLMKRSDSSGDNWIVTDTMRGWSYSNGLALRPNVTDVENNFWATYFQPNATGFTIKPGAFGAGNTYIYITIRRGLMKVPTVGTSVFTPVSLSSPATGTVTAGFPVDLDFQAIKGGNGNNITAVDRLRGSAQLITSSTGTEVSAGGVWSFASNTALIDNFGASLYWLMRRAPSFLDIVCYTGNNANSQTIYHNLGVTPEMIIVKRRSAADSWYVYTPAMPATNQIAMYLNSTMTGLIVGTGGAALWGLTSTTFQANYTAMNLNSNDTFVAYMFATCPGVSKVGSYTGTGALQTINCSFTTGSRFVLIRRIDSAGGWYVWDSARGISSGDDPYIFLNNTAGEVTNTNYVDTTSVGFQVTAAAPDGINANGGKYIFLAIA